MKKDQVVLIKFVSWDKPYNFLPADLDLKLGDQVIVETDLGKEIGTVVGFSKLSDLEDQENLSQVVRLTEPEDYNDIASKEDKLEAMAYCQEMIKRHELPMKLVDVHISCSKGRLNFAFIADGRVDFRDLVRDLTSHFRTNIRLTQIGTRDEAKMGGDFGPCGRGLCCKKFITEFSSITSDMAECQQIAHRGSDRLSGMCGRLMCCLSFEQDCYKELAKKMPALGSKVNVDGKKGVIIGHHILKQSVDVRFPAQEKGEQGMVVEVDLNRHKKKKEEKEV
ncbi:MAG: stage 0 sporulation protein [Candidatus Pacebacteria bacterium]|nr:stage 0 sporulation protein [Candidatus Paceibacterota bacterium]